MIVQRQRFNLYADLPGLNLGKQPTILAWVFSRFRQSLQVTSKTLFQISHDHFLPRPFQSLHTDFPATEAIQS
jgi:hypothetical protein